jgi:hypothetical protein
MNKNSFHKNNKLDLYLTKLGASLAPAEKAILNNPEQTNSNYPTVIKIGSPRVGGTLLTQWAASGSAFFNPTNFLSRFFKTPVIGTLINELLSNPNFDYRDEFADIQRNLRFSSDIGKTSGLLAPHEFWYFWRHFLHLPDVPTTDEEFLKHSDFDSFSKSLKGMQAITGKSLFLKGHLINFYLEAFLTKVPDVFFFYLKRDIRDTALSLYKARIKWTGSAQNWFSHKPRSFGVLQEFDPVKQVVGQVYFIEKEIQSKLSNLSERCFSATYEDLCRHPSKIYKELVGRVNRITGSDLDPTYTGPNEFSTSQHHATELDVQIEDAINYYFEQFGPLCNDRSLSTGF